MLSTVDVLFKGRPTAVASVGWRKRLHCLAVHPSRTGPGRRTSILRAFVSCIKARRTNGRFRSFRQSPVRSGSRATAGTAGLVGGEQRRPSTCGWLGDGWHPVSANPRQPFDTPELYGAGLAEVRAMAEADGRDPHSVSGALLAIYCRVGEEQKGREGGRLKLRERERDR